MWPNNLIATDYGDLVLVDWAFVGDGALGEDVGNLVPDSVFDRFVPARRMPALAESALAAYVAGLAVGGWDGNERHVHLGFYASAVKYDWLVPLMLAKADEDQVDYGDSAPVEAAERYRERGTVLLELTRWAERARQMVRDHPDLVSPDLARAV